MNYINPDTIDNGILSSSHTGTMRAVISRLNDGKPPTYVELKIRCELLEAEAVLHNRAMGDMSKEVCDLNNQIQDMLVELQEMQ